MSTDKKHARCESQRQPIVKLTRVNLDMFQYRLQCLQPSANCILMGTASDDGIASQSWRLRSQGQSIIRLRNSEKLFTGLCQCTPL